MAPTDIDVTAYTHHVDGAADTVHATLTYVCSAARGKRVSTACDHLAAAEKMVRQTADDGGHLLTAAKLLTAAVKKWQHDHPDDATLTAAQKAVDDAVTWANTCEAALDGRNTGGDTATAQNNLRIADDEVAAARKHLTDVINRRKLADKALEQACGPAMAQLRAIKGATAGTDWGGTGDGYGAPGGSSAPGGTTGSGSHTPAATSGTGSGTTGSPSSPSSPATHTSGTAAPGKSTSTPGTTAPGTATPGTSTGTGTGTGSGSGSGSNEDAALAAALLSSSKGGQSSSPAAQQTSTPTTTTPTAASVPTTTPAPTQQTAADNKKKRQAEQVGDAALSAAGIGTSVGLDSAVMPVMPQVPQTSTATPVAQVTRPAPTSPLAALSTPQAVNPKVSGTSVAGLTTSEDVSGGRATPTAFTETGGPATTVSEASTGGAQPATVGGPGAHPTQGMPQMNPAALGAGMPVGGARSAGRAEEKKILRHVDPQLAEFSGETTLAESVRHYGTIGVNTDHAA
ncbi:hypothetical protein [Tsukamurella soli]